VRLAPNYAGVAASIFGFAQLALSALAVQAMGYVPTNSWLPPLLFCAIGAAATYLAALALRRRERAAGSA
jgi:hypothetical protein